MDVFDLFAKISLDTSEYDKGLDHSEKKMSGFSSTISSVGNGIKKGFGLAVKAGVAAIGTATTAVTAFAASAVSAGMDFDAAMSQVGAISGATEKEFDSLREKALEMGSKTKFSATESAEAFNYMAMAGWKTEDMLNGIEGIMSLAAASGEDLATTSDIVTDALTGFGLSAQDSGHFADVLAAASSNANTNVAMMGETFKYFAPLAGTFKFTAEDTALAIGLMANSGIKASQAGTALRGAFSRLAHPTKNVQGALLKLGLATEDTNLLLTDESGKVRSLGEIMDVLRDKLGSLDDARKAEIATQLFGQEAMSGMLAIVNASSEDYEKLKGAIADCDGAASDMAETMQYNLGGDITIFKSALEGAKIAISDGLTPSLREFVQFGTTGIQTLSDAFKEGGFSGAMEAFGTVLAEGLNQIVEALPKAIDAGMQLLSAFGQGILDNLPVIIDAASQVLGQFVEGIVTALPSLADGALQIVLGIANGISEMLPNLIPSVIEMLSSIVSNIGENAGVLIDAGWSIISGIGQGITNALGDGSLGELATGAVESVLTAIETNADKLQTAGNGMVEVINKGFNDYLPGFLDKAQEIIPKVSETIQEVIPQLIETGKNIISSIVEGLVENGPQIIDTISQTLGEAVDVIFSTGGEFLLAGADIVSQILDGIVSMLPDIIDGITELLGKLIDNIVEWLPKFLEKGVEIVVSLIQGIVKKLPDILKSVVNLISQMLKKLAASLPEFLKSAVKMVGELISGLIKSIPDLIASIPKLIGAMVDAIFETDWIQLGCDIIWGLIEGILSMIGNIGQAIWDLAGSIADGFCSFFGIASPSKLFREYGNNLDEGLSQGISDGTDMVTDAVDDLGRAVKDPMSDSLDDFNTAGADFTGKMAGGITSMTSDTVGATRKLISEVLQTVKGYYPNFLDKGKDIITNFMHGIKEKVTITVRAVDSLLDKLIKTIERSYPDFVNRAVALVEKLASGITNGSYQAANAMRELVDKISDIVKNNNWESIGSNIVEGIAAGIRANSSAIEKAIKQATAAAKEETEEAFEISSPSKVFKYYGQMIDEGLAGGIRDYSYMIEDAVGVFGNVAQNTMESTEVRSVGEYGNNTGTKTGTTGMSGGYVQNITINAPTELDPSEIARQTRNATRETILQLRMA